MKYYKQFVDEEADAEDLYPDGTWYSLEDLGDG